MRSAILFLHPVDARRRRLQCLLCSFSLASLVFLLPLFVWPTRWSFQWWGKHWIVSCHRPHQCSIDWLYEGFIHLHGNVTGHGYRMDAQSPHMAPLLSSTHCTNTISLISPHHISVGARHCTSYLAPTWSLAHCGVDALRNVSSDLYSSRYTWPYQIIKWWVEYRLIDIELLNIYFG